MKQHFSVLMLFLRSSLYKALLLFAAMGAVEAFGFWRAVTQDSADVVGLEETFASARTALVFFLAFLYLCQLLAKVGCEFTSKQSYTLRRLSISHTAVFLWQAVANCLILLLFLGVQTLFVLLMCRWYLAVADPARVSAQTVFLACYRNDFLHALLPLEHYILYLRNALLVLAMGTELACCPVHQRRGGIPVGVAIVAGIFLLSFQCRYSSGSAARVLLMAALAVAVTVFNVHFIYGCTEGDENAEHLAS